MENEITQALGYLHHLLGPILGSACTRTGRGGFYNVDMKGFLYYTVPWMMHKLSKLFFYFLRAFHTFQYENSSVFLIQFFFSCL